MEPYTSSLQHILAELERIDLLIQLQVWRARQLHAIDENFQGLYIPEEEVDALMAEPAGLPAWARMPLPLAQAEVQDALNQLSITIAAHKAESRRQGILLRLDRVQSLFQLSPFAVDVLLICLAPEIDLRYERLFGYLQDDVTKRRPSVDLVLNLLSPTFEAKLAERRHFAHQAPLFRHHLIHLIEDQSQPHPPLLSHYLKADRRIVDFLYNTEQVYTDQADSAHVGMEHVDERLHPYVQSSRPHTQIESLLLPSEMKRRLVQLTREYGSRNPGLIFYFQGGYGVGKESTAAALSHELGMGLLMVDGEAMLSAEEPAFETAVRLILREALLQNALLYWSGFDVLLVDERRAWRTVLLRALEERPGLTILAGNTTWEPVDALSSMPFVRVELPRPTHTERVQLWQISLDGSTSQESAIDLPTLATKFRFSGGQIRDAVATARNLARWRDPGNGHVSAQDLYAASRLQSNRKLGELARKITPHYVWQDIVLPVDRMQQLHEIVNQLKYRARVYDTWGFDRKLAMGKGLNTLFAGPSGTGKTMAADIMAGELGLDLYKIDLSGVVSKYIGETEKNLARIFDEAATSNAILFFDEADALFGKRSEVRDAHDRYANIEISYLLQKMEEYDGMVILATNLHKNMDDAFVRRMHFTVEFPFPDQKHRLRIWQKIWPEETPRSPALDLDFMAERFDIAGGNIRNIALAAAFLAAADSDLVEMGHLIHATQREYQKMGKVLVNSEFGKYGERMYGR